MKNDGYYSVFYLNNMVLTLFFNSSEISVCSLSCFKVYLSGIIPLTIDVLKSVFELYGYLFGNPLYKKIDYI